MSATQALRSVVLIPESAWRGIDADVRMQCRFATGVETAGVLYLVRGDGFATGPGEETCQTRYMCEWDASAIAATIDYVRKSGGTVLGRWHKHTAPILLASDTDKESARAFLAATGMPEMLDLIVACDEHDRPIGWAVYVCTPEEYRRAELVWGEA